MDSIYLVLVVVLFVLAFSDLIVGVSNDAVNFLNSAIGSKVAPRYVIMILASLGILVGATFSSGMMEVARKGIFFPDQFYFSEIMIIFLAVMLADVILLDTFNTFGLPTSTTVSIVFELLGAAVAVSMIKISSAGGDLSQFINSATALKIIGGILLSIVVAFTFGTIIQYLTRIVFSFNYTRGLKYFGAVWGAIAITSITYFILIKGAKGSSLISEANMLWIMENTFLIMTGSFVFWLIVLQIVTWFSNLNILRLIVLIGTFALAMAFAGNDLVNFIGVPLAGFSSYKAILAEPGASPDTFLMTALNGKVQSETYLLIIAGLVMAVTLWLSKKARSVTETEINLSRQGDGDERFGSSLLSKNIVRLSVFVISAISSIIPKAIKNWVATRFAGVKKSELKDENPTSSFDLIRASVNLTVASILISFATSLKLPLSTTYVTFLVAMGTSFGDGAWGRESAVYRISGVISVIGGWFITAIGAFLVAFSFAYLIHWGGSLTIGILVVIAVLFIIKTHAIHKKRQSAKTDDADLQFESGKVIAHDEVIDKAEKSIRRALEKITILLDDTLKGLASEDRKLLKESNKEAQEVLKKVKKLKNKVYATIADFHEDAMESGHFYVQVIGYLKEVALSFSRITFESFEHVDNNHNGISTEQAKELQGVARDVNEILQQGILMIKSQDFDELAAVQKKVEVLTTKISDLNRSQLKRIKRGEASTRNSILYLGLLAEIKILVMHTFSLFKADRDYIKDRQL